MWLQTAATPYFLQPWNSAPLTGNPPEAIAAKQERVKRSHSFYRGFVFRVYARLNIFLLIQPPHCRAYTLHIFIVGKESTNLITSLYIEFFPSICRMGFLFAPNKRIFSHGSYPARAFFGNAISYQLSYSRPILERNPEPIVRHGSRGERRFWWLYKPSVVRYGGILSA
jgi:hypothetical protein